MSRKDILKNILLLLVRVLVLALVLGLALVALLCFILNSQVSSFTNFGICKAPSISARLKSSISVAST